MEIKLTRQEAIDILVDNKIFYEEDVNNHEKATEFYIEHLMNGFDIRDIDEMAQLNTLFGYDIGIDNWSKISFELWCNKKYWDDYECGIEILELDYKDKELLQNVCKEIGLDVSFDKWRTKEIEYYEYY